jgi:hypothetical protein
MRLLADVQMRIHFLSLAGGIAFGAGDHVVNGSILGASVAGCIPASAYRVAVPVAELDSRSDSTTTRPSWSP